MIILETLSATCEVNGGQKFSSAHFILSTFPRIAVLIVEPDREGTKLLFERSAGRMAFRLF